LGYNFLCPFAALREIFPMSVTEQIRSKVNRLPRKPDVYLVKDRFGTVIYASKARDLRRSFSRRL